MILCSGDVVEPEHLRIDAQVAQRPSIADVIDLQGSISYWNRAAEVMYGWPAAAVIGRNILEITPKAWGSPASRRLPRACPCWALPPRS